MSKYDFFLSLSWFGLQWQISQEGRCCFWYIIHIRAKQPHFPVYTTDPDRYLLQVQVELPLPPLPQQGLAPPPQQQFLQVLRML